MIVKRKPVAMFKWPIVTEEDEQAVIAVMRSGNMSGTDITRLFETEWGQYLGTQFNLAHCNEPGHFNCNYTPAQPDLLRTGIYLGAGADRPDVAKGNVVANNEIGGYGMSRYCVVAAPGVSLAANTIGKNDCADEASFAFVHEQFWPLR